MKSVSVVIPNYNGKSLLEQNIPPLLAALRSMDAPWEIIVVDDASSDDSAVFLKTSFPEIRLLINEDEQGFCRDYQPRDICCQARCSHGTEQ